MSMRIHSMLTAGVLLGAAAGAQGDAVITIDLSYKVVLNPADGQPPPNFSNADIDQAVADMNDLLSSYWRGYRVQRVGAITQVGGLGDVTGPSQWYNTNFFDADNGSAWKDQMEAAAMADPTAYAWNFSAINLYITNGICGGICSFPTADEIIIIGACSDGDGPLQLHEIGHYYDHSHTQGRFCGDCGTSIEATDCAGNPDTASVCAVIPGDDGISDTLCDLQCWDQDGIANWNYGAIYSNLSAGQQSLVDDVFFNVMSYHSSIFQMTEEQLDLWADTSNGTRFGVCDGGRTRFVDPTVSGGEDGSSTQPYDTVLEGVNAASSLGLDIVLLRPGVYPENLTITKGLTLRVTRPGPAVIGTSSAPAMPVPEPPPSPPVLSLNQRGYEEGIVPRIDIPGGSHQQLSRPD